MSLDTAHVSMFSIRALGIFLFCVLRRPPKENGNSTGNGKFIKISK
jgi:hypothetical protein